MKIWDLRKPKIPIKCFDNLDNFYAQTNIEISPDESFILTGTSVKKGQGYGQLIFVENSNFDIITRLSLAQFSVVRCLWPSNLNQIILGMKDGSIKVLYDPVMSSK